MHRGEFRPQQSTRSIARYLISYFMHSTNPSLDVYPLEATKEFVDHVILGSHTAKSYIIVEKENEIPIGIVSLINIDYKNRNAECIIDIGEKDMNLVPLNSSLLCDSIREKA